MAHSYKGFETVRVAIESAVATVTLNRPEIHNAFNEVMIADLNAVFTRLAEDPLVRVVVLTGSGKSFCAGADLNWMKKMVHYSLEENLEDSMKLAEVMHRIYVHPKPTVARVNGSTIGGGTGLVAACDIAVASSKAKFSLSEVRIGLVPACIAPYVIRRLGEAKARELFLTGERISADQACMAGLVNSVAEDRELDDRIQGRVKLLLRSGPNALRTCKELIERSPRMALEEAGPFTAKMIAKLRISEEGQEGMNAFLEKRLPAWADETSGVE